MDSNTDATVFNDEDVKVIGLAGSTLVACGTSHPIVQRNDSTFCRYALTTTSRSWLPVSLFDQYLAEGRVSRLASPVSLPAIDNEGTSVQPVVMFVNNEFIAATGIQLPRWSSGIEVEWTDVVGEAIETKATCQPTNVAHQWLNDWASKLCHKIDTAIASRHSSNEISNDILLNWTHLALCAATDKSLRWKLHLRFGAFMAPEGVRRTFDSYIQHEFPQRTWESYLYAIKNFGGVIQSQPSDMHAEPGF